VSKLALGTAQFGLDYGVANAGGQVPLEEARRILAGARRHGLDTLDTAMAYGDAEARLGKLATGGFRLVTKLPAVPAGQADVETWVRAQLAQSLARLRRPCVDGLLLHRPQQLLQPGGDALARALLAVQADGLAGRLGVSVYDPAELGPLCEALPISLVQAPLNLLDRRLHDSGWAARLAGLGVELHVRSAFLQGLLLMPAARRTAWCASWPALWAALDSWLADTGLTPLQACLRHAAAVPGVDRVVVGVDDAAQLDAIVAALGPALPALPAWTEPPAAALINPALWEKA
jgi:hypothetical protein